MRVDTTTYPDGSAKDTNITFVQGESLAVDFAKLYSDAAQTTPVNITGYTATLKIRSTKTSTATLVDLSTYLSVTGAQGKVTLTMTSAQSKAAFTWQGKARYDLILVSGTNELRPLEGYATVDYLVSQ